MKTEIFIPSSGVIELYDDIPISLNYNVADIKTPEKRDADYSKTIKAPGTKNNNKLLAHIFEIGAERLFNPNKKTNAQIVVDKVSVMKGILQLKKINTLENNKIEYELVIKGRVDDLFMAIKDKLLTDIDWDDLDHTWNKTNIQNSWSAAVGAGYVYPMIDYTGFLPLTLEVKDFRPATYIKEIWDRIFSYAGFQYSSTFLNTDYFKHLIIPFSSEKFLFSESVITNSIFRASSTSNQPFTFNAYNATLGDRIRFTNDSTAPNSDAGNVYSTITSLFTAPRDGIYSFAANASYHFQMSGPTDITGAVTAGIKLIKNLTQVLIINTSPIFSYHSPSFPTGVDVNNVQAQWQGFLSAGDTVEVDIYMLLQQNLGSQFPTSQSNYIKLDSYWYNSLSPELVANNSFSYDLAIPQNVKMSDFLISLIRMFNLYFEYDKDTPNKIFIEPRNDYYNTTVQDWSKKIDAAKDVLIEPMGALDSKRYIFNYKQDKDFVNERYQAEYKQIEGESYGIKIKTVDNDFLKNDYEITRDVIFSPSPNYSNTASDRVYPVLTALTPPYLIRTVPRILYYGGLLSCNTWSFYERLTPSPFNGSLHTTYPYCGHLDHPYTPTHDLSWGVPKEIYYLPTWAATYTNNNLYNRFWSKFINEITDKDSSIVTGWFHLTPADIAMVDFRHIYRFGVAGNHQNYRLNKIYDYNPTVDGLTKCEFIKTKDAVPFVFSATPAYGTGDFDNGDKSPLLNPSLGYTGTPPSETGTRITGGTTNFVPPDNVGILITGGTNTVGTGAKNINLLASSGNIIAGGLENVTLINTSGVTVTESNTLYIFGTKWNGPCPITKTVAQMQAMQTSGTIGACAEYLITDILNPNPTGLLRIRGRTSTLLEPMGTLYTSGDVFLVGYDLTLNQITSIHDEEQDNHIYNPSGASRFGNCLTDFPLRNDNFAHVTGRAFNISLISSGACSMFHCEIGESSTVSLDGTGGSASMSNVKMLGTGSGANIIIANSSIEDVPMQSSVSVNLSSGSTLVNSFCGSNCNITVTSGTVSFCHFDPFTAVILTTGGLNKLRIYGGLNITFPIGPEWTGVIDRFAGISSVETTFSVPATTWDFVVGGVDYGFCGVFRSTTTANRSITAFANASLSNQMTTKFVRIYGSSTHTVRFIDGAGAIELLAGGSVTLLNTTHWIDFMIVTSGATITAYEITHALY